MTVRISVCVPTVGRDTLGRALRSCEWADEVLVDFNHDDDHGYAARTRLMKRATGTHIAFMDDDDVFAPAAPDVFRARACDRPVIAQMQYRAGAVLWRVPKMGYANYGTPCFLVPNDPARLGRWEGWEGAASGGDAEFMRQCAERMGPPVFVERVVALIDPLPDA